MRNKRATINNGNTSNNSNISRKNRSSFFRGQINKIPIRSLKNVNSKSIITFMTSWMHIQDQIIFTNNMMQFRKTNWKVKNMYLKATMMGLCPLLCSKLQKTSFIVAYFCHHLSLVSFFCRLVRSLCRHVRKKSSQLVA